MLFRASLAALALFAVASVCFAADEAKPEYYVQVSVSAVVPKGDVAKFMSTIKDFAGEFGVQCHTFEWKPPADKDGMVSCSVTVVTDYTMTAEKASTFLPKLAALAAPFSTARNTKITLMLHAEKPAMR